jgi:hypothetical protein
MDSMVEAVLALCDRRATREAALREELTPEEVMWRVDEFLISVSPGTGTLLALLPQNDGCYQQHIGNIEVHRQPILNRSVKRLYN